MAVTENSSLVVGIADQRRAIKNQIKGSVLQEGGSQNLISGKWFKAWKDYVEYDSPSYSSSYSPGTIDNYSILAPSRTELLPGLMEEIDYALIPPDAWNLLHSWYGGGPAISRQVLKRKLGGSRTEFFVEVYPLRLRLQFAKEEKIFNISREKTVGTLKENCAREFGLDPSKVRLFITGSSFDNLGRKELANDGDVIEDIGLSNDQSIFLTKDNGTGEDIDADDDVNSALPATAQPNSVIQLPPPPSRSTQFGPSYSSSNRSESPTINSSSSTSSSRYNGFGGGYGNSTASVQRGLTGLGNLGNTCFMNSALQCLSNTPELTAFFVSDNYKDDINRKNPLGMGGELAEEYGGLVKELWSGGRSSVSPSQFKWRLARFAPHFSGYAQHDSQELLAFLLDGLHEDLNRILQKPYIETKEEEGRPDEEVAAQTWSIHKRRNDSIIVDLFQAQLKSTLVCPDCGKISVTFDPFMYLSVPLPGQSSRNITLTFYPLNPSATPIKFRVSVGKKGSILELKQAVCALAATSDLELKPQLLAVGEIYNCRFYKIYQEQDSVTSILESDVIAVYELEDQGADTSATTLVSVLHRIGSSRQYTSMFRLVGLPLLISAPRGSPISRLVPVIVSRSRRYLTLPPSPSSPTPDAMDIDSESRPSKRMAVANGNPFTIRLTDTDGKDIRYFTSKTEGEGEAEEECLTKSLCTVSLEWSSDEAFQSCYNDLKAQESTADKSTSASDSTGDGSDGSISLDECIRLFTAKETLGENDPWYCPQCKEHKQASKQFQLWTLPSVLVVHLKRFSYTRYLRDKIDTIVRFPLRGLDLSPHLAHRTLEEPAIYDLFAVSNHYGGLGGGHYTAFCQNKDDGKWYKFDDSHVSEIQESAVQSTAAYVLFYKRRDIKDR
mmetsp:Transcript_39815/g.64580  ORF Transcript_39815/g.64580 Transcript_39815/m.64580 type:complete len:894 (-) Transcript_39815:121-2802(-)